MLICADPGVTPAESRALRAKPPGGWMTISATRLICWMPTFGGCCRSLMMPTQYRGARCASRGTWMYASDHPGGHLRSGHPIGYRALAA